MVYFKHAAGYHRNVIVGCDINKEVRSTKSGVFSHSHMVTFIELGNAMYNQRVGIHITKYQSTE